MARLPRAEQRNTVSAGFQSLLRNQKSQRFFLVLLESVFALSLSINYFVR